MSGFKGTKGPWYVVDGSVDGIGDCVSVSKIKECQIYRPLVCVISKESDLRNEDIPNALLISKAPEMLEMLENLVPLFPKNYSIRLGIEQLIKDATTL